MARVVISGYYGFRNAGDEAVLFSMVRALKALSPGVELTVLSHNPRETEAFLPVRAVNRWSLREVWAALRRADLLLSGGGSLLQDVTGPKSLFYYLGILMLARLSRTPFMLYAQGVGPLKRKWGRWLTGRMVDRAALVTVRDSASRDLLRAVGVRRPGIQVTADPVIGLKPGELNLEQGKKKLDALEPSERPRVALALRSWRGQENFYPALGRVTGELISRGWQPVLLPFQFPHDLEACREAGRYIQVEVPILREYLPTEDLLGFLSGFQLVVGMRLHALIMAAVLGIPFVAIPYDLKVEAFARQVEQPCCSYIETITYEGLCAKVMDVVQNLEIYRYRLEQAVAELRPRALANARLALELLDSGTGRGCSFD
ncbi:MAG: hypothetical protein PWP65_1642 [Clostridia bacterium]|nr:hypothetical protein [Clostridia bacterium]